MSDAPFELAMDAFLAEAILCGGEAVAAGNTACPPSFDPLLACGPAEVDASTGARPRGVLTTEARAQVPNAPSLVLACERMLPRRDFVSLRLPAAK